MDCHLSGVCRLQKIVSSGHNVHLSEEKNVGINTNQNCCACHTYEGQWESPLAKIKARFLEDAKWRLQKGWSKNPHKYADDIMIGTSTDIGSHIPQPAPPILKENHPRP